MEGTIDTRYIVQTVDDVIISPSVTQSENDHTKLLYTKCTDGENFEIGELDVELIDRIILEECTRKDVTQDIINRNVVLEI